MTDLYPIGVTYVNYQTPIENGGVIGLIVNGIEFVNGNINLNSIFNVALWTSYIKEFLFNTTRLKPIFQNQSYQLNNYTTVNNPNYAFTILMIIWLVTFLCLLYQLVIITLIQNTKDKVSKKIKYTFTFISSRTKVRCISRPKTKRIIMLTFFGVILISWIIFMILVCTSQYLLNSQFTSGTTSNNSNNKTNNSQTNTSIKDAVSMSFGYLNNFFNILTNQTKVFLATQLSIITSNTSSLMNVSIVGFGNEVLITLNITRLFNTAQLLLTSLDNVVTSMIFINNNCQSILKDIDNTKGSVTVYRNNLGNYLTNICKSMTDPSLQNTCRILQAKNDLFNVNIQTGSVSSSSSVIMIFLLKQFNINVTSIVTSFNVINTEFQAQLNTVYNKTVNQFDISSYLDLVTKLWNSLIGQISPSLASVSAYNSTINSYMDYVAQYENIVIILCILLLCIGMLFVVLFSFRDSIQERFLGRCSSFAIQLIFIFILFISAVICIAVLILSNFSQSEMCNQINTTKGINVLDQMVNTKLATFWNTIAKSLASSSQDVNITLAQPMNIFSGIKDRCQNMGVGLLSVLGMSNIVNVTQIVRSQSIMTMVSTAEKNSLNAFLAVNPQQIIPSNLTAFLSQVTVLTVYFDAIDYKAGIQELQKPLLGLISFEDFFNELSSFAKNAANSIGWNSDLRYFNDTVTQLLVMMPSLVNIQRNVTILEEHFQVLQNNRNNSLLLNMLNETLINVQNLFKNSFQLSSNFSFIYNKLIAINLLNSVETLIGAGINIITNQIVPCHDLSMIFQTLTTTFCSNINTIVSFATFGILLLIEIIFCQIIVSVVLISIALRFNIEDNTSEC